MIVKILSSAKNFEGIDYSERKNELGKSQLLKAKNFEALGHGGTELTKVDYINYMKLICDSNPRVKNRQFHAVISVKGNSHSPEELSKIAEQYLKSMGYGANPYLIYFHADTHNNHVHMVSTRVDKSGNKVSDSFEKIRSQKVMQEILNQDPHMEAKMVLENALSFSFSSKAQFKLLLEQQGFKITEKDGRLNLIKYGLVQADMQEAAINERIKNYQEPEERIHQLKAIFHKYKKGMEVEKFMETLGRKFGLKLILHQHPEHTTPYGYTIIDYNKKHILKGSQIMPLKQLILPIDAHEKKKMLDGILNKIDYSKSSLYNIKMKLSAYGFEVNHEGTISSVNDNKILGAIDPSKLHILKYNGRVKLASQFNAESEVEKAVIAKLFHIRVEDISVNKNSNAEALNYYSAILRNSDQKYGANELLQSKKLEVIGFRNTYFLLDGGNKFLFEIEKLIPGHKLDFHKMNVRILDNEPHLEINQHKNSGHSFGQLAQLFDLSVNESSDLKNRPKRKNKQRQI